MASFTYLGGGCACSREKCSADCATYKSYMPKPVTNADRIRAFTDDELAEMHIGVGCPPGTDLNELCFDENGEELLCTPPRCRECWLKWLRQEAST